jgi:hypothetical protein
MRCRKQRWTGKGWTGKEVALLGTVPDEDVAAMTGKSLGAVRSKRRSMGIPNPRLGNVAWKPWEVALLGNVPDAEVARQTGRTVAAVRQKRFVWMRAMAHRMRVRKGA